ncbi:MAG: 4Fe-4S single cluster domain-containing protein [Sporichthyaceae bacterium]
MSEALRIRRFLPSTAAEGPGRRAALWVQGCTIRCPGCFNPHTWPSVGGETVPWLDLHARIRTVADQIEGVTLLGGEPFDQAGPLAALAAAVRADGLSVMTFTGHVLEDLETAGRPEWTALLATTDLLVDGPYRQDLPDRRRPWVGSTNQRFHARTARYAELVGSLALLEALPDRLEVRIGAGGEVRVNGFAEVEDLLALLDSLAATHPSPLRRGRC